MMISVVIADDHPIVLQGLKKELEAASFNILAAASNGADALRYIEELKPDVALLDIEMPILTGLDVAKEVKKLQLQTKIVVMTYHKKRAFLLQAKQLQIDGYLLKENGVDEIAICISKVLEGQQYFSSSFSSSIEQVVDRELQKIYNLTPSEKKILRLIAEGKTSSEIADMVFVSIRTVQKHRSNIIQKLGLDSGQEAIQNWVKENKAIDF